MARHQIERLRHGTRRRTLTVETILKLTPRMLRIGFTAADLHDFVSASPDDHVKLFFPRPDGGPPCMRDYTPRKFDSAQGKLVIDFALHDAGVATGWASTAKVGDTLEVGGPRGSAVIPQDFDWYLLIGDETALPAIGRWVEEARPGVPVTTVVAVGCRGEVQHFGTDALWTPVWAIRNGKDDAALLRTALKKQSTTLGEGFVWIAAETSAARALRAYVIKDWQHPVVSQFEIGLLAIHPRSRRRDNISCAP